MIPSLKLTAKAPEYGWLEDEISFWVSNFQGRAVSFREGNKLYLFCKCFKQLCIYGCGRNYERKRVYNYIFQGTIDTTYSFNLYIVPLSILCEHVQQNFGKQKIVTSQRNKQDCGLWMY